MCCYPLSVKGGWVSACGMAYGVNVEWHANANFETFFNPNLRIHFARLSAWSFREFPTEFEVGGVLKDVGGFAPSKVPPTYGGPRAREDFEIWASEISFPAILESCFGKC